MGSSKNKPDIARTVHKTPVLSILNSGSDSFADEDEIVFSLENPTEFGLSASIEWTVIAVPHADRILVEHRSRALGEVPIAYVQLIRSAPKGSFYQGRVMIVVPSEALIRVSMRRIESVAG
jgi:hypothetical protein